eukprot:c15869_g1_i4.p1 GENE.c15869_g1_i4~~c15869_g1_i4.p1  ORF type:complete len:141 (-),score=22.25 c15869_g1_i4:108-530(-)
MGIFLIPKGESIPLHDHRNMTVLTMALFGSARMESYDIISPDSPEHNSLLVEDRVLIQGDITSLHPDERNIHAIYALENFAMLDITFPPYGDSTCTFYDRASELPPGIPLPAWVTLVKNPTPNLDVRHEEYFGDTADDST